MVVDALSCASTGIQCASMHLGLSPLKKILKCRAKVPAKAEMKKIRQADLRKIGVSVWQRVAAAVSIWQLGK
jgi:hypothetical protein